MKMRSLIIISSVLILGLATGIESLAQQQDDSFEYAYVVDWPPERHATDTPLDYDLLNHGLQGLSLQLQPWASTTDVRAAARAKEEVGGRLETLQVRSELDGLNPGTRYIRATIQRSLYYFAQYVDARLSDPEYPGVSPDRWHIREAQDGSGDLVLVPPQSDQPEADSPAQSA